MAHSKARMSPAELPVWRYIADHQPIAVRQIAAHFFETTGQARTTVLTVVERLRKKGYLSRCKIRGVNHYAISDSKGAIQQSLIHEFVENALGGSLGPFIDYMTQSKSLSEDELQALKEMIDEQLPYSESEEPL